MLAEITWCVLLNSQTTFFPINKSNENSFLIIFWRILVPQAELELCFIDRQKIVENHYVLWIKQQRHLRKSYSQKQVKRQNRRHKEEDRCRRKSQKAGTQRQDLSSLLRKDWWFSASLFPTVSTATTEEPLGVKPSQHSFTKVRFSRQKLSLNNLSSHLHFCSMHVLHNCNNSTCIL